MALIFALVAQTRATTLPEEKAGRARPGEARHRAGREPSPLCAIAQCDPTIHPAAKKIYRGDASQSAITAVTARRADRRTRQGADARLLSAAVPRRPLARVPPPRVRVRRGHRP
jgi:hypothetical protein